ncbi:glyoxalase [Caulobacter sp. Root655]|uniref:VOC family protein n=1 Tax=Caulobacter sp. Root655 TaxID=1736578 RepID=UPI0006FA02BD|nr:VOC family protein [Caulobacter sp. Root655]KRA56767.1 glyoxalase [Caulobacter sp. Root655]
MAKVLGLGGVFFKAQDPAAVRDWYARVLGFEVLDWGGVVFSHPRVGGTNWSPFDADTRYFEPSDAPFMVNFIVDDLDGILAKAAAQGVSPTGRQDEDMGRFAWLVDPAGIKIELWQPAPRGA